jgi:Tol biopolymer transport system component
MPFRPSPFSDTNGRFSHDDKWIAYSSNASGTNQIYVQRFSPDHPATDAGWTVSTAGGNFPAWRSDGHELFYISLEGKMMAAAFRIKDNVPTVGTPTPLFNTVSSAGLATAPFDVTADGQRFLFVGPADSKQSESMTVIVNWQAKLKE